jgi:hypothetical protein
VSEIFSAANLPFIAGFVLALLALTLVLGPMFSEQAPDVVRERPRTTPKLEIDDAPEPGSAIDALREIEFDRATGKLSEDDYDDMKAKYTAQALVELRASDAAAGGGSGAGSATGTADAAERLVKKYRPGSTICATHGLRPEPDALYCSECGRYLRGSCERCGTVVTAAGAHFCTGCGHVLAA